MSAERARARRSMARPASHDPSARPSMNTEITTETTAVMMPNEANARRTQTTWSTRPQNPERKKNSNSRRRVRGAAASTKEVVLDDAVDGTKPVPVTYFLALGVGAAVVRDADLVDANAELGHLGGDLGLEAEAILLDLDGLDDAAAKRLIACLHVREVQVREHVREEREEAVSQAVPEIEHAVR